MLLITYLGQYELGLSRPFPLLYLLPSLDLSLDLENPGSLRGFLELGAPVAVAFICCYCLLFPLFGVFFPPIKPLEVG